MSTAHVVQRGETLHSIAKTHGVSASDIVKWNALTTTSLTYGQWLAIPTPTEVRDRKTQMSREKDEAICPDSFTERHIFQVKYDQRGRTNIPSDGVVCCEACGRYIRQEGARWVTVVRLREDEADQRFLQMPQLVIREQDTIDELL